ncbi:MAG: DUF1624 domain-containing protein [Spirochaetes bacterium]|nr:DUF1624 domain-containing protein [Spirochaetota bacterium]
MDTLSPDTPSGNRIPTIDILRGLALVLMVLDHTRSFFHEARFSPSILMRTYPSLYLTRLVTHPAAPVFFLLAGTAAYLAIRKTGKAREVSRFLLLRGLLCIALEVTVVNFFWFFSLDYEFVNFQAIWALGWAMILLSAMVRVHPAVAGVIGIVLIAGHNMFDGITPDAPGGFGWLWKIIHTYGTIKAWGIQWRVVFPLVPWAGVMLAGYWLGTVYDRDLVDRRKILLRAGLAVTAAFFILRWMNVYGDPYTWYRNPTFVYTVMSFFNCEKYPPSLSFLLMTLGPALVTLGLLEGARHRALGVLELFGRVPFFFYLTHLPLAHLLSVLALYARYGEIYLNRFTIPDGRGFGLAAVYLVTAAIVAALYVPCKKYEMLRHSGNFPLLRYL